MFCGSFVSSSASFEATCFCGRVSFGSSSAGFSCSLDSSFCSGFGSSCIFKVEGLNKVSLGVLCWIKLLDESDAGVFVSSLSFFCRSGLVSSLFCWSGFVSSLFCWSKLFSSLFGWFMFISSANGSFCSVGSALWRIDSSSADCFPAISCWCSSDSSLES